MSVRTTYRQQYIRCGKQRCLKCKEGKGHGPYWYAFWSEGGRTVSKYIGARLPSDIVAHSDGLDDSCSIVVVDVPNDSPKPSASRATRRAPRTRGTPTTGGILPHPAAFSANDGEDEKVTDNDGAAPKLVDEADGKLHGETRPLLRIFLLGQIRVERRDAGASGDGWLAVDPRPWQRPRVRSLLGCLLSSPGRRLSREQLLRLFWPSEEVEAAANRLNGAVHQLRQAFEATLDTTVVGQMLRREHDMLVLADQGQLWVDSDYFEHLIEQARATSSPHEHEALLEEAASLYRGPYLLEELYAEWAAPRRDILQQQWIDLLLGLAGLCIQRGELQGALDLVERLRIADPLNETALQLVMLLLTRLDRRGEALRAYDRYVKQLAQEDEAEPLPETAGLYHSLRRGHTPQLPDNLSSPLATQPFAAFVVEQDREGTTTLQARREGGEPPEGSQAAIFPQPPLPYVRGHTHPLLGREHEMVLLRRALYVVEQVGSSSERHPHFLILIGEPGIGKTRLVEALCQEAYSRGWAVVWGRSHADDTGGARKTTPYDIWRAPLHALLHELQGHQGLQAVQSGQDEASLLPAAMYEQLSIFLPANMDSSGSTVEAATLKTVGQLSYRQGESPPGLWDAVLSLLDFVSTTRPLLLVLDDLQGADESSFALLTYLAHHLHGQRVLILGTCRDGELPKEHPLLILEQDLQRDHDIAILELGPLAPEHIDALLAHLPHEIASSIHELAGGNPLFAEELARHAHRTHLTQAQEFRDQKEALFAIKGTEHTTDQRSGEPSRTGPAASLEQLHAIDDTESFVFTSVLTPILASLLRERLNKLSPACRDLLNRAAQLGDDYKLQQLLSLFPEQPEDAILDLLDEALHAGVLMEEGKGMHVSYRLWHPLAARYLYSQHLAAKTTKTADKRTVTEYEQE